MILGQFSPAIFFKLFSTILATTITLIYFISQYLHQEEPIAWISGCAQHYPEFLFFRFAAISGAVFMILGWMTNTFYLKTISHEHSFNLTKYQPQIPMILGIMGSLFLTVSTATLDTGVRKGKLHVHCASGFFIFTAFAIFYTTALYWIVYHNTKALNKTLLILKTIVAGLIVIMIFINSSGIENIENIKSTKGVILEWAASYSVAAYFYLLSKDVEDFKYQYESITIQ